MFRSLATVLAVFHLGRRIESLRTMSTLGDSLLECQRSAYLKEGTSRVLLCERIPSSGSFRTILDNSVLYPEGGGQPSDLGTVNGVPVLRVSKPNDPTDIERIPSEHRDTCVEVELADSVEVGSSVRCVIDWERRYDFMQQHTAQHLFSAVADKLFKAETVGWSLGADSVTVDLESEPLLTPIQLQAIESDVNECIRSGLAVSWSIHGRDELESVVEGDPCFRGTVKGAAAALASLRLVRIDTLDLNPCGGTHVQSLSELQCLTILGTEKDRKALRVRFVAGQRAVRYLQACVQRETLLGQKLSAPSHEHVAMVEKVLAERKDLEKQLDTLQEELAVFAAKDIISDLRTQLQDSSNGVAVLHRHRVGGSLKYLLKVSSVVSESLAQLGSSTAAASGVKVALYLTGGDLPMPEPVSVGKGGGDKKKKGGKPNPVSATPAPFVVTTSAPNLLQDSTRQEILALVGGKGGGRPGLLQGQVSGESRDKVLTEREKVVELLCNSLQSTV